MGTPTGSSDSEVAAAARRAVLLALEALVEEVLLVPLSVAVQIHISLKVRHSTWDTLRQKMSST